MLVLGKSISVLESQGVNAFNFLKRSEYQGNTVSPVSLSGYGGQLCTNADWYPARKLRQAAQYDAVIAPKDEPLRAFKHARIDGRPVC